MDSIDEASDSDTLKLIRVDDVDLKAADVGDAPYSENDVTPSRKHAGRATQSLAEEDGEAPKEEEKKEASEGEKAASEDKGESASNGTTDGNSTGNATATGSKGDKGDFGFEMPESIEASPVYKKEMTKVLGKTKEVKKGYKGYGYYGNGGQGSAGSDGARYDIFDDDDTENDKEKEGYYPNDEEESDEQFIHDLHHHGYDGYKSKENGPLFNAFGKQVRGKRVSNSTSEKSAEEGGSEEKDGPPKEQTKL